MATLAQNITKAAELINNYRDMIEDTATTIIIPEGTQSIHPFCFCWSSAEAVVFPSSLKVINYRSFQECYKIKSMIFPYGFTTIYAAGLIGCSALEDLYLPNTLEMVYGSCISGCSNLLNVTFENGFNCNTSTNMDFSVSTRYTANTLVGMLNALADRTGLQAYTLTIGATNLAKLTAEQIAIATNKNWNLT